MRKRVRQKNAVIWRNILLILLLAVQFLPARVYGADQNLPDVQFTTGKYGQNCLTASNWSKSDKTLNLTQNVYLDAAARKRADQGELKLNASVKVGANGSRTNTRKLEVKCFDQNGKQVGSTWQAESKSYSAKHHWNTLSVNDKTIPKNTYRIQYYVYNHIGTKGDLEIENCSLIIRDEVSPKILNITASTNDGREWNKPHPAGTEVTYTLHFSERVSASVDLAADKGDPWIEPYSSGVSTSGVQSTSDGVSTLSYTYTIPGDGDVISDNHNIAFRGVSSFSVWDDAGNQITAGLTEDDVKKMNSSLASGGSLCMDNRPPELTGITSEGFSKDTVLIAGDTIKLHLNFHENIKVTGTPSVTFSNGKTAAYIATGTTTNLASFSYTVGEGDDVNGLTIQSFQLNGIVDGVNQDSATSPKYSQFTAANINYMDHYGIDIDTQPPTITMPEFGEDWLGKNDAVQITVTDNTESITGSGVKLVQYAWASQSSTAPDKFIDLIDSDTGIYSIPAPEVGGNCYLWSKCEDDAGNVSEPICSGSAARFDVTLPEITLTKKEAGDKVVGVTAAFSDDESGITLRRYQWLDEKNQLTDYGELEENQQLPMPSLSGTYLLKLYAEDAAGNSNTCEQEVCVDVTPPVVKITCESSGYAKSHILQVSYSDKHTAVEQVEFQWKPGNENAADNDWEIADAEKFSSPENENGEWRLYVRATDSVGNQTVEYRNCLLDNTPPEIIIVPDGNEGDVGKVNYSVDVAVNDIVTAMSKLKVEYGCSGSEDPSSVETWTEAENPENISIQITLQDDTYLHVKASDEAGNTCSKTSKVFAADKNAPEGTLELAGNNPTNNSSINVQITAEDDYTESGDIQVQFSVDGLSWGEWEKYVKNKMITFEATEGEHTIQVRFKDEVGNESEPVSLTVVYDITPPVITLNYSESERTNQNVTVTAELSDGTWLTSDSYEFKTNGEYTFQAKDEAGNVCSETAKVTWIDRVPPEFTLASSEADARPHKTATFSVQSNDTDLGGYFWRVYPKSTEDTSDIEWKKMDDLTETLPELSDGIYIVEVYAEDDLGNRSDSRTLTIVLDNTPPEASVSYSPEGRTSENVTATLSLQDDNAVTVTSPEDGSFTHTFTDNGSFTFTYTDAAGNTGSMEAKVDWIDRTLPRLDTEIRNASGDILASGQWTKEPVTVELMLTNAAQRYDLLTFNGQDIMESRIQEVEGIELVPNESDTYLVSSYGVLEYQITDSQTNLTSSGSLLLAVDTKEPFCSEESIQYSARDWTNQDVTVRIQAEDDLAKTITYLKKIVDENEEIRYEEDSTADTHIFTENGEFTFYFKDQAGNLGFKTVSVNWIDKEKPEAHVFFTTADGEDYDPRSWTNQDVTVRLEFASISPVSMQEGEESHLFTTNGSHTFSYIDAAGNQNTTTVTIDRIDKVAPTGYMTASIAGWTNEDVEVTLHASDDASGAEDMKNLFTENGVCTFVLKDLAGNSTEYTYTMDRIDKQAPQISLFYTPDNITKTPFPVYVSASADERVRWENSVSSWKFTDNGTYDFTAVDRAGNSTSVTALVDWISQDLPEVQLYYSTTERTNEDVQVELRPTDEKASIRVLNNDGSRFYTFKRNGRFTFQYTDAGGKNTDTITAEVNWIDKTGPKLTVQTDRTELGMEPVHVTVTADEPVTWPNGMTVIDETSAEVEYTENVTTRLWAEDDLGNRGYVPLVIDCIDCTAPVISIEQTELCIPVGQTFDPLDGVKVEDDHPVETPLSVDGSVNTQETGQYILLYTAVDAAGNTSTMERIVHVFDPDQFQVQINGKLYMNQTICISSSENQFELIHAEGGVSVKLLKGKATRGDFKTKGSQIAEPLLDGSYIFPETGYYTLLIQDQERNTKLVQFFVTE